MLSQNAPEQNDSLDTNTGNGQPIQDGQMMVGQTKKTGKRLQDLQQQRFCISQPTEQLSPEPQNANGNQPGAVNPPSRKWKNSLI